MPRPTQILAAEELKAFALTLGFQSVGVCRADPPPHLEAYKKWIGKGYHGSMDYLERHIPLKSSPTELLPGAKSVIAVALNYNQPNPIVEGQPHIARYALGRDYHKVLRGKLRKLASWVESHYSDSQTRACVDSAPIMERDYAQMGGLGWFGKNTCLIDSKRGSWFFIGLLLTTLEFEADAPAVGGCGTCGKCIAACPTGAIVFGDDRWQVDARQCISYLTIEHKGQLDPDLAAKVGDWTFGCDICQEVCPFNEERASQPERATTTAEPDFLAKRAWPDLEELRIIQADEWNSLTSGSPIRRAGRDGIKRNADMNLMAIKPF